MENYFLYGHRKSQSQYEFERQMDDRKLALGRNDMGVEGERTLARSAVAFGGELAAGPLAIAGGDRLRGARLLSPTPARQGGGHGAGEAASSQASAEGFAYCFFGCPEVEEGLGGVGGFGGGEPAAGEGLDGEVSAEFCVDAYRARVGGGHGRDAGGVGEGDVEAFDQRPAGGGVGQGALVAKGRGEFAEQVVGGFAGGVGAGAHPDVHGFRCGARGFIHREKVTR
ncbi:hypothetical protein GCM10027269_00430 [Kribbella endophytica]